MIRPGLVVKRLLDLVLAGLALALCSPVMLAVAVAILAAEGPPVVYRQQRPGLNGRPFTIYKFRTMGAEADARGNPVPDAQRVTRLGNFLRNTSLDELPEFWNVLTGEMSLVGPRPLMMRYLPRYTPEQARRHEVKPGITGLAQVSGRNALTWDEKFRLDVWYVDHRSLGLDLAILARTVASVLVRRGTSADGHAMSEEFMGTEARDRDPGA